MAFRSEKTNCVAVRSDLDELSGLQPDWDGYGAPRINPKIIEAARRFVDSLPDDSPKPTVVPMSSGNLQFEWHHGRRSIELEFESPERIHYLKWSSEENVEEEDAFPAKHIRRAVQLIGWCMESTTHVE